MKNIWISAVHIPGKQNTIADFMSRSLNENTEWQLSPTIFKKIVRTFDFEPEIDLFAPYLKLKTISLAFLTKKQRSLMHSV